MLFPCGDLVGLKGHLDQEDGHSLSYPPIPHIDTSQSHRINSHSGTKRFLASLSPSDRTTLFFTTTSNNLEDNDDMIFEKVLTIHYDGSWETLLGQFQLSFIIFLCCSCLASLEHWYV